MDKEASVHLAKVKEAEQLKEQLAAANAAVDRMAKSARAAARREEEHLIARQQGDLAIEQVGQGTTLVGDLRVQ